MFVIPDADALVSYIKDFTGSSDDAEIKQCIFLAELAMRNIELPALRTNPYETFGVVGPNQLMPIPSDMNKPILFFQQGNAYYVTTATATGVQGSTLITLTSVPGQALQVGMNVTGTGIANGASIAQITSATTVILNLPNIDTVSGTLNFATSTINANNTTGPWIVYDRIGDRDIITQGLVAQLYLTPVNVPAVIRGKFSEVGDSYQFLPYVAQGAMINLYYYKAWNLLFTPATLTTLISTTGTVGSITGSGPWNFTISDMTDTTGLTAGDVITSTEGTGNFGNNVIVTVDTIVDSTSITAIATGVSGTTPVAGTVTDVTLNTATTIQTNPVLQTWPEGYVYNTLSEYYIKRHSSDDAEVWKQKAIDAWKTVEDQNNLGKWSGGHTRMTSIFQPRRDRSYSVK